MPARLLIRERTLLSPTAFVEIVIWRVPVRLRASDHDFKYSLALISYGRCVLRYDNEAGKGDHKHAGDEQVPYRFNGIEQLQLDFWDDVARWRTGA